MASGGHSSSRCAGISLSRPLLLRSTGSRRAGSVIMAHGPSCSAARGIFPDQGSNPCPLHWQADSQPLRHQGSPKSVTFYDTFPPIDIPLDSRDKLVFGAMEYHSCVFDTTIILIILGVCSKNPFLVLFLRNKLWGFPGGTVVENLPANAGDRGSSPGLGRSHMPRSG